nr:hypothetical protein [Oceanococcus sp. HetDA_MAG_MS8]
MTTANGETVQSDTTSISSEDGSVPSVNARESTVETVSSGFTTTVTNVIDPGNLQRFDLSPGESYQQTYVTDTTTNTSGSGVNLTQSSETTTQETVTYVGRETISVPAGTYETCYFRTESTSTTTAGGASTTLNFVDEQYFDISSHVLVREVSTSDGETDTTELQDGTVNGVAVR